MESPNTLFNMSASARPSRAKTYARSSWESGSPACFQCIQVSEISSMALMEGRHRPWSIGTNSIRPASRSGLTSTSTVLLLLLLSLTLLLLEQDAELAVATAAGGSLELQLLAIV